MKNILSIACRNSVVDQDTNSLSFFEVLEGIDIVYKDGMNMNEIKVVPLSFHIVSIWVDNLVAKERKFDVLIEILDNKGASLKKFDQSCIMPKNTKRLRVISKINGFGFKDQGEYRIIVKYREIGNSFKKVSEIPLDIKITK